MTDQLSLPLFDRRLDALGADLDRWPQAEAAAARALLARSAEARKRHAEAVRLDALVAKAAAATTPNGFAFRVVGEVSARRSDRWLWLTASPGRFGFASASFCAAALSVGLALGAMVDARATGATSLDLGAAIEVSLNDGDL
ncbi:hypothetical protein ACFSCV_08925 [Methylopila henanensis]|uniref:Uncharacterized protein n=1 Tax=Methylopila henanensis TaxID=873516 RepID=A0ABW4K6J5_9HYPH